MPLPPAPLTNANLASLLWTAAADAPQQGAITDGSGTIGYAALRDRAAAIAVALTGAGVRPGDRVGIFLERGIDAAAAIFAAHAAGAVAVVVNDRMRPRQVEHILRHSGARAFLSSVDMLARQPRPIEAPAALVDVATCAEAGTFTPLERQVGDLAQIIYTSGSSGLPKGVTFTHGALRTGIEIVAGYLGMHGDDRVASLLSFSSVYGLNQLLCTVRCAARLVVEVSPVPHQIVTRLAAEGVTIMAAVPPLWLQLLSVPSFTGAPIPTLRQLQNAGGHLPVHAVRALRRAQPQAKLFLQYGQTETFRGTFLPPAEVDQRPDCMGRVIPCSEIMVLRDDLTPCEPGEVGELVHRGPTIAIGYWHEPELTARVFRPHPLRPAGTPDTERVVFSGDMVRRDADGFLYFVSRADRLIKTLGFRVGPDEIADVLYASGEVSECVVSSEVDPQRGERIVAFVVLLPGGSLERLKRFCGTELPRHMQPSRIAALEALPRLASGKYDVPAMHGSAALVS